jgi:hypothetical protein
MTAPALKADDLIVIGYSDPATAEKAREAPLSQPRTDLFRLSDRSRCLARRRWRGQAQSFRA